MDEATIQKIAVEVARLLPSTPWMLLLVQVLLTVLAAAAGAFFGEYLRTRGKNLATKADFDSLQEQLSATTETVETIKSEVAQKDWARREWTNLRRVKLEALLEKAQECHVYLDRQQRSAWDGQLPQPERDCIQELSALAALYFPELKNEADNFVLICRTEMVLISELRPAVTAARENYNSAAQDAAFENFKKKTRHRELLSAHQTLTEAARSLLERIMDVEEH
jgi:hypothetical protein